MLALRLLQWQSDPVLMEVPEPRVGPGQVLVRVGASGACHSDLHIAHDYRPGLRPWSPPFTLGHETAGWVEALGAGVDALDVGQPVAVYGSWGCGRCRRCRAGLETYCQHPERSSTPGGGGGLGADGGMAELLLVPDARHVLPLPDGLDPVVAAPLTDAGLTPYHAVRRSWPKLPPGSCAVVIGAGGLGHLAIQVLKATTAARVVAVDTRDSALEVAARSGCDAVVRATSSPTAHPPGGTGDSARDTEDTAARVVEAAGGRRAELVLDCVGTDATLALAAATVGTLGDLTVVGIGGGSLPFSFFGLPFEVSVASTYWGGRDELTEVLDLAARGLLRPEVTTYPLSSAPLAYQHLAAGAVAGRAVVLPGPTDAPARGDAPKED